MFTSFDDVLTFLDERGMFHMDLGLDRIQDSLKTLELSTKVREHSVVQVVGTNGKGSTSTFLAALAKASGVGTGLYGSPHLVTYRERIRIDGMMLSHEAWAPLAQQVFDSRQDMTCFEFLTVLAVLAFAQAEVPLHILEAGLGGKNDATTAIPADIVCFTPIALDHVGVLGDSIHAIALDKAGALHPHCIAVTSEQDPEVMDVLETEAQKHGIQLYKAHDLAPLPTVALALQGEHQRFNAQLAWAVWALLAEKNAWVLNPKACEQALATARIAGRLQYIAATAEDPPYLVDGAHNPHGLRACIASIKAQKIKPRCVIFSCMADKDIDSLLPLVLELADGMPILTPTIQDNERAVDGDELAHALNSLTQHAPTAQGMPRLFTALETARGFFGKSDEPVLVCGSLYLLGEFFTLKPNAFI